MHTVIGISTAAPLKHLRFIAHLTLALVSIVFIVLTAVKAEVTWASVTHAKLWAEIDLDNRADGEPPFIEP
jgi:hypothetical protein